MPNVLGGTTGQTPGLLEEAVISYNRKYFCSYVGQICVCVYMYVCENICVCVEWVTRLYLMLR